MSSTSDPIRTVAFGPRIERADVVDTRVGTFLVLDRYPDGEDRMPVREELGRDAFLARAWPGGHPDRPDIPDRIDGADLADILVQAYDASMIRIGGRSHPPTFAFRTPDGRIVHQHST